MFYYEIEVLTSTRVC